MSYFLAPKAPNDIAKRVFPCLAQTASCTASGVTLVSYQVVNDGVELTLSGGTAGATATLAISYADAAGATLTETIYLPIIASTIALGQTVRDVCIFAARKVTGITDEPDAEMLVDLIERLEGIVASWKTQGAELGIALPLSANTPLSIPDYAVRGLRNALIVELADLHPQFQLTQNVVAAMMRGLQQVKVANLPDERERADYF